MSQLRSQLSFGFAEFTDPQVLEAQAEITARLLSSQPPRARPARRRRQPAAVGEGMPPEQDRKVPPPDKVTVAVAPLQNELSFAAPDTVQQQKLRQVRSEASSSAPADEEHPHTALRWEDRGWSARILKNDEGEGWAVEVCRRGEALPILRSPWPMTAEQDAPKPLDRSAFNTLVTTASEILQRNSVSPHTGEQQRLKLFVLGRRWEITLEIAFGGLEAGATLSARDADDEEVARQRVPAGFQLECAPIIAWIEHGFPVHDGGEF